MTIAQEALNPLPPVPNVGLTCHVATWYWAARTGQNLGNNTGHTTQAPGNLAAHQRACVVIAEDTIVARAVALNL
jgi:hypothetical protein